MVFKTKTVEVGSKWSLPLTQVLTLGLRWLKWDQRGPYLASFPGFPTFFNCKRQKAGGNLGTRLVLTSNTGVDFKTKTVEVGSLPLTQVLTLRLRQLKWDPYL